MKITTRIILGFGLLITLLAALTAYQLISINRLQSISHSLSLSHFHNTVTCLHLLREQDRIEEYARRSLALGNAQYLDELEELQENFENSLGELEASEAFGEQQIEVRRLAQLWNSFKEDFKILQQDLNQGATVDFPKNLEDRLEGLRIQTYTVYNASLSLISSEVEKFQKTADTTSIVLWCFAAMALFIGILVAFLMSRSISVPLAHLIEGTRAIAEGKAFYRLDTSRKDEFGCLAKDFNTMNHQLNELKNIESLKKEWREQEVILKEKEAELARLANKLLDFASNLPARLKRKRSK